MDTRLLVVGAGPKAIALCCKARVLEDLGMRVPQILVLESDEVGAHWTGSAGLTDGHRILCTNPERDLGCPYSSQFGAEVDRRMAHFSWHSFLVEQGRFAEWLDRRRPRPTHAEWATYLKWAATKCAANIIYGQAKQIQPQNRGWEVAFSHKLKSATESLSAAGVVLTGPGAALRLEEQEDHSWITDAKSFWLSKNIQDFKKLRHGKVAVVGSGETAATIVLAILNLPGSSLQIHLLSKRGSILTREETYEEVKHYSNPSEWSTIPLQERVALMKRTDTGVMSPSSKDAIDRSSRVRTIVGTVRTARMVNKRIRLTYISKNRKEEFEDYNRAIVAIGFNALSWADLFPRGFIRRSSRYEQAVHRIQMRIGDDLSLEVLPAKLHLPMLAGLRQGPGFPKLTCLGILSDRILASYVSQR